MALDKFTEGAMLQKEMERLEIEEKNDDNQRLNALLVPRYTGHSSTRERSSSLLYLSRRVLSGRTTDLFDDKI
ncbi:hypothetical protein HN011_000507 [Eciton burchellii]|nr:hypothetical protein HN011_000507 [Eciton burchellii]